MYTISQTCTCTNMCVHVFCYHMLMYTELTIFHFFIKPINTCYNNNKSYTWFAVAKNLTNLIVNIAIIVNSYPLCVSCYSFRIKRTFLFPVCNIKVICVNILLSHKTEQRKRGVITENNFGTIPMILSSWVKHVGIYLVFPLSVPSKDPR